MNLKDLKTWAVMLASFFLVVYAYHLYGWEQDRASLSQERVKKKFYQVHGRLTTLTDRIFDSLDLLLAAQQSCGGQRHCASLIEDSRKTAVKLHQALPSLGIVVTGGDGKSVQPDGKMIDLERHPCVSVWHSENPSQVRHVSAPFNDPSGKSKRHICFSTATRNSAGSPLGIAFAHVEVKELFKYIYPEVTEPIPGLYIGIYGQNGLFIAGTEKPATEIKNTLEFLTNPSELLSGIFGGKSRYAFSSKSQAIGGNVVEGAGWLESTSMIVHVSESGFNHLAPWKPWALGGVVVFVFLALSAILSYLSPAWAKLTRKDSHAS